MGAICSLFLVGLGSPRWCPALAQGGAVQLGGAWKPFSPRRFQLLYKSAANVITRIKLSHPITPVVADFAAY